MSDNLIINETLISRDNLELYKNETNKKIRNYVGEKIDEVNDSIDTLTTEINQNKADISNNKNDISQLFDITKGGNTVTGESSYTLEDAVDYPVLELNLYGKSVQDGTPSPDNPVDIVSVGDSGSVAVQTCGKNLLDYTETTSTINGVTFTINKDHTITVNGTATALTFFNIVITDNRLRKLIIDRSVTLTGCPANGSANTYQLQMWNHDGNNNSAADRGNGITYNFTNKSAGFNIAIRVVEGTTINNLVFKPMLRFASVTNGNYEPYNSNADTTANITTALPLCGIPVSEGGNYTDSTGQQWVCDELVYNADGTGSIIKNTAKIDSYDGESITTPYISTTGDLTTGATIIYALDTPQEITLTSSEISALRQLMTYNGVTNITNSDGADMDVKYCTNKNLSECVIPITTTLQAQIDELKSAVLSLGGNV